MTPNWWSAVAIGLALTGGQARNAIAQTTYLPASASSRIVSVSAAGQAAARIIVQTQAVAVKETGPKQTVARFGEVYAFSPATLLVHRDEPTLMEFWNLQPDDDHDFLLMDPHWAVMMKVLLPSSGRRPMSSRFTRKGSSTSPARCTNRP
jgi:hypothetical protein